MLPKYLHYSSSLSPVCLVLRALALGGWLLIASVSQASEELASRDRETADMLSPPRFRMESDNDLLLNSDNKFTNGAALQWQSRVAMDWESLDWPEWTGFGVRFPGLQKPELYKRQGFAVGQNMQTPNDLSATELIVDDVPYVGTLGVELNWIAFDDQDFFGYALNLGVIGPVSGAEVAQKFIHELIGAPRPRGWDNQVSNEPAVNFHGMRKRKLGRVGDPYRFSADLSISGNLGVGTAITYGEAALELRMGFRMPTGFAFLPNPLGRSITYDASIPESRGRPSFYVSAVHRESYVPHFVFIDGSLWRDSHSVNGDHHQTQTIYGLHFVRENWGIHASFWDASRNVRTPFEDNDADFGTIAIEWRLR